MNAQGRSQRPGTNASREENTARSALSLRQGTGSTAALNRGVESANPNQADESTSFIRFGRAEEAAREAEQREVAKRAVARQAQLNMYEAEMERARQAPSVPVGSAIPNSEGALRAAAGDGYQRGETGYGSAYTSGASASRYASAPVSGSAVSASKYRAPYAQGGAASGSREPNRQHLGRAASQSAALRIGGSGGSSGGGRRNSNSNNRNSAARSPRPRRRQRIALLFFCLPLIAFVLIRTFAFGAAIESMIRDNAQGNPALDQFIMDNHIELTAVMPGSAWAALALSIITLSVGFVMNALAWYKSNKPASAKLPALLTVISYAVAAFAAPYKNYAPTICFTVLLSLLFSTLSFYALAMAPPPRKAATKRQARRPVSYERRFG